MRLISLFLLTAALPAPLLAQSAQSNAGMADATQSGDQIVVTAGRAAQPLSEVGQSITIIDAQTILTHQALTPLELLRQVPGVTIAQNGGIGTTASVFIRGADSDQTVALIDGVKITDPSSPGNSFDFSTLMIGNIDRIEVLRGPSSVLWGSQAIGGVINLITRQPTDALAINASVQGGSFGTAQGVANVSDKFGPFSMSVGGGYFRSDGISAFDRELGGREADGYRNYGANASFNLALADNVSIDLRGYYSRGHTDIDGFIERPDGTFGLGDDAEYQINRQFVGYTGLNATLFDGRFHNRLGFSFTDNRNRDFNPDNAPFSTLTFLGKGRTERADYQGDLDLTDGIKATFGAEHEYSRYFSNDGFGDLTHGRETLDSGYAQLILTPIKGLTATGGVRYDHHNQFGGHTTASGSVVYSPNEGLTAVRGSYSEGFKAPSLFQLYSNYGNNTLRPETSRGWDAGVTQRTRDGKLEASVTWFHRVSNNLIEFVNCVDDSGICTDRPFGTYDNVDRARSQGAEVAITLKPVEAFVISASYTYLDARDRSPGSDTFDNRLARRPTNSITLNADYDWAFGLKTGATVIHVSSSFDDAANTERLKGYVLTGLRASYPLGRHFEVFGRIDNLFDVHYETALDYGQPGRAAYGGIRLSY
jgi:vitamin B12 transporter